MRAEGSPWHFVSERDAEVTELAGGRFRFDVDTGHVSVRRPGATPLPEGGELGRWALSDDFDSAVGPVPHPAHEAETTGPIARGHPEEHPLYQSVYNNVETLDHEPDAHEMCVRRESLTSP